MFEPSSLKLLLDSVSDLILIFSVSALLLFSIFSLFFILNFRCKTQRSLHLKDFNSLWSVRILLVSFISLWALNELIRLPIIQRNIFLYFPSVSFQQQISLCQYHVVLSQGFFEPGFLVTLLFLVNFSIKKKNPDDTFGSAVAIVFAICLPILILQIFFIFYASRTYFNEMFWRSGVVVEGGEENVYGNDSVLCVYPVFSTIIFGTFATVYELFLLLSCWKVVSLVINKGLRVRIYILGFATLFALPTQVTCLAISTFFRPDDVVFVGLSLLISLSMLVCALIGEGILVIRPIADALAVGGECCWVQQESRLPVVSGGKRMVESGS